MMQAKSSAYGVSRNGRLSATRLYVPAARLLNRTVHSSNPRDAEQVAQ
jgi:hypothetical protein